ncbi:lipoyl protein ligase domain-containing protein [Galactobacter caseinivorans]|uniref:Lipoate--protein ligase family protein n=1 Tax=Galactobacter caseinivorans TaxID=2676123 RepID=A0A496PH32_9MICC|nr:lipoate--protein ligase family protein [Galactobacter caseinivorans]RKW69794.1 lipoate--protein ligase family protein [Galactobacter caseinivorans]
MSDPTVLTLLREHASADPAADLERGVGLLRDVAAGRRPPLLRIYRPAPTLAFGQRDTRLPGFDDARRLSAQAGFAPVVRAAGGRAAAYHPGTLIVDQIQPSTEAMRGHHGRFQEFGELFAAALRSLGVQAGVGEIPGEYCPGEYSVHGVPTEGGAPVKLVGTAQRVVAGAWLFTSVVVVTDSEPLREVTTDVYDALGLPLDPGTVGAAEDLVPAQERACLHPEAVAEALLHTWAQAGYRTRG